MINILRRCLVLSIISISSVFAASESKDIPIATAGNTGSVFHQVEDQAKNFLNQIQKQPKDAKYIFCLGPSGAGKSSYIKALLQQYGIDDGRMPTIDSGFESVTKTIELYNLNIPNGMGETTSVVLGDCQGFDDSDGSGQDLFNTLSMYPISDLSAVHFFVFVPESGLTSLRAMVLADTIRQFTDKFPGIIENPCFTLVLTQGKVDFDSKTFFNDLSVAAPTISRFNDYPGIMALLGFINLDIINNDHVNYVLKFPNYSNNGDANFFNNFSNTFCKRFQTAKFGQFKYEFALTNDVLKYIENLVNKYETQTNNFLNHVSIKLEEIARQRIQEAQSTQNQESKTTAEDLKKMFGDYSDQLRAIDYADYWNGLSNFLNGFDLNNLTETDPGFSMLSMLNNLLDPDSAVTWPQEWHQKAISEFKRLAAAKTEKVIVSQGELKEIGDYSLVREFKERVNLKVRKGEVWRRALKRNTKYYLLTIFSDYCFLKEAEQDETITVGERQGEKGDHGLLIRNKFFKETLF